jgi:hypothetical protein
LHLQPCNQCGAIDNRTAITCYKCGAEFNVPAAPELAPVPAAPELAPVPAAPKRARVPAASKRAGVPAAPKLAAAPAARELAAVPAAPVPEYVPAPPILEHQVAKSIRNDGGFAIERGFGSKSSAQAVGMIRQGLRREVTETQGQAVGVADRDPTHLNPDPAHSAAEPQPMDETVESERAVTATGSRRARSLALLTLLLAKSPAQVVGMFRQGLRREVTETQGQAADVADRDPTHLNPDPTHSTAELQPMDKAVAPESVQNPDLTHSAAEPQPMDETVAPESVQYPVLALSAVEPQPMDETVESERAMTPTASRRARSLAVLTLLLATAGSGYYYYDRSAQQLAQGRSVGQPAPSMPDGPISVGATTATVATQVDATSAPKDTTSQPTTGAAEVEKAPSRAARVVAKPRTDPEPLPANRPLDEPASVSRPTAMPQAAGAALSVRRSSVIDAGVTSRKDPPIFKECTEAVAALGLCSPSK